MAGWCGARTTSTRELLLDMPAGACHASPGRPVLPPLEPEAARFSEIGAICRLAPRLLCEQRRTPGAVGGAKSRLTPHIRLESCSPGSVLQPQTRTLDVIRSPAPSRARSARAQNRPDLAVFEHRVAFGGSGGRVVWRENNLNPRALTWYASRGMSCLTRKAAAYTRQPDYDKLSHSSRAHSHSLLGASAPAIPATLAPSDSAALFCPIPWQLRLWGRLSLGSRLTGPLWGLGVGRGLGGRLGGV